MIGINESLVGSAYGNGFEGERLFIKECVWSNSLSKERRQNDQ